MDLDAQATLERIERELKGIRKAVDQNIFEMLLSGFWRGAGFIIGSVIAIAVAGVILSVLGFIPGYSDMAEYLRSILERRI